MGKIRLAANLESDGTVTSVHFQSLNSTGGLWLETLTDVCSDDESIAADIWWKVEMSFLILKNSKGTKLSNFVTVLSLLRISVTTLLNNFIK